MTTPFDPKEYWDKRLAREWDLAGVGYRALGSGFNYWSYAICKNIFAREVVRCRKSHGANALDIGSGTGFFTGILADMGYRVSGIDISPTAVKELRKKFPSLEFTEGKARDVIGSYDLITAIAILFHIVDDEEYHETLKKIHDALKDDGYFIFSENFPSETIRYQHIVMRSNKWLVRALQEAGFEIVSRRSFGSLMNEPIKKKSSLRWKGLMWILHRFPSFGWVIGAILYPLEFVAVLLPFRPSAEIVICRKVANDTGKEGR